MIWIAIGLVIAMGVVAEALLWKWYREDRRLSNEIRKRFGLPPW